MAKASTRFRNRKINFKTRITIRTGTGALDFEEDGVDGEVEFEEDKKASGSGVETGVDKEEEHELHLQAVLASSTASVTRTSGFSSSRTGAANASTSKPVPRAYIPTPDSTGTIEADLFTQLYPPNAWIDPITYVRFSDTVEDATTGAVLYTMDEEDEDWLEAYNASLDSEGKPPLETLTNGTIPSGARSPRKGKGEKGKQVEDKGKDVATGPISDDDFELIMEYFETTCDEKAPVAHVNISSIPTLEDMEAAIPLDSPLASLKFFARSIFPHWKDRRIKRGGKNIIPQLDYDESNENNPYVCFRRRELKSSRKTRRSDAQNVERLIRLRNDLYAAHALMVKTRDRERLKLESIEVERKIFDSRCEVRELKRRLGEADGDEDILISKREKKRKREEVPQASGMRISLRTPNSLFSPSSLVVSTEDLKVRKERAAAVNARVEAGLLKKKEADQSWEDYTDSAFSARMPANPARYWRAVETVPGTSSQDGPDGRVEALAFVTTLQPAIGHVRTSFRRRVGRGGRVMLDRLHPGLGRARLLPKSPSEHSDEEEEDEFEARRRAERFRYDQDASIDFPAVDEPTVIDDFDLPYLIKRSSLLQPTDGDFLTPDSSYLDQAFAYVSQEPERPAPPVVFGRQPPRSTVPVQAGGPGGVPIAAGSQAQFQQMQMQAQAQRLTAQAAQQAVQQAQRQAAATQHDQMRKSSSSSNSSPVSQNQTLPMQMPMPPMPMQNGAPVQGQWLNGAPIPTKPDGSLNLPPGFQTQHTNHHTLQQQQQRLSQGLAGSPLPTGANGQPATSRLSAPPFSSNSSPMPLPIQSPHHQHNPLPISSPLPPGMNALHLQQRPSSANPELRQPTLPPSRPTSAASSHASPNLQSQGLPAPQPLASPGLHPNGGGKRPQQMIFPQHSIQAGSPAQFAAMKQAGLHQQLPYNGGYVGAQT